MEPVASWGGPARNDSLPAGLRVASHIKAAFGSPATTFADCQVSGSLIVA